MTFDDTLALPPEIQREAPLTSVSVEKDFVDWRKGRQRYAVWAVDVDTASLRAIIEQLRDALDDWLLPGCRRQPHITLRIGGFPAPERGFEEDYSRLDFAHHLDALIQAGIPPFRITVGAPRTFPSAPYLPVEDHTNSLARLRHAFPGDEPGWAGFRFVPHVTVGLYRRRVPVAQVIERMAACPGLSPIPLEVQRITLMTYEASIISGPLHSVCAFDLAERRLQVLDAEAMRPLLVPA